MNRLKLLVNNFYVSVIFPLGIQFDDFWKFSFRYRQHIETPIKIIDSEEKMTLCNSFLWHGHKAKIDYSFRQIRIEMFALKRSIELLKRLVLSICQESCTLSVIDGRSKCRYWFQSVSVCDISIKNDWQTTEIEHVSDMIACQTKWI